MRWWLREQLVPFLISSNSAAMLLADPGWRTEGSELPGPQSAHTKKKIIQDHQIGETCFQVVKGTGSWRIWCDPCMVTELISRDPHSSGGRGMVTGGGRGGAGICGVRRRRGRSGGRGCICRGPHRPLICELAHITASIHKSSFCASPFVVLRGAERCCCWRGRQSYQAKIQTGRKWVIGTLGQGTCAQCIRSDHKSNSSRRGAHTCACGRGGGVRRNEWI